MGIRIPKNQTVESKYTSGGEFMFASTQNEYKGYYYELNNKTYAGEKFDSNNLEIIKIKSDKYNTLLGNAATYIYGVVSGIKLNNKKPIPYIYKYDSDKRYFSYNTTNKIIKEINKDNFDSLQSNPLYVTVALSFINGFNDNELNEAEKRIPGIKTFAETSYTNPSIEDGGNIG